MRPVQYRCYVKTVNNPEFKHLIGKFLYSDDGNGFRFIISPVGGCYIERLSDSLTITEDPWDSSIGLTDKNGKDIYEVDIVRFDRNRNGFIDLSTIQTVEFYTDRYNAKFNFPCFDECEVIGNIYENPELLSKI